jgi:hypothetical protein
MSQRCDYCEKNKLAICEELAAKLGSDYCGSCGSRVAKPERPGVKPHSAPTVEISSFLVGEGKRRGISFGSRHGRERDVADFWRANFEGNDFRLYLDPSRILIFDDETGDVVGGIYYQAAAGYIMALAVLKTSRNGRIGKLLVAAVSDSHLSQDYYLCSCHLGAMRVGCGAHQSSRWTSCTPDGHI